MSVIAATSAEIGPFITGGDIEESIIDTLKQWLPSYIAEGERKGGLTVGKIPAPRGWAITGRDLDKFTSDQLPCVIVMSGGIVVRPLAQGYPGGTAAVWNVDVGAFFSAAWGRLSRQHAQLYVRAIALCLIQRPLVNLACSVDFIGEDYDEVDYAATRTYSVSVGRFTVEVENMLWRDGGPPPYVAPPVDPTDPLDPWVTVKSTDIAVNPPDVP